MIRGAEKQPHLVTQKMINLGKKTPRIIGAFQFTKAGNPYPLKAEE